MAREKKPTSRLTVPVASRTQPRPETAPGPAARPSARAVRQGERKNRIDILGYTVLVVVSAVVLMAVSMPLNNFYAGRMEIARLNDSVAAKLAEKDRVLAEIEKYRSRSYIEQEARRRLGVVAPGETAYRIMDPAMERNSKLTTEKQTTPDTRPWHAVLWAAVAQPPSDNQ